MIQTIPTDYILNATGTASPDGEPVEKYENDLYLRAVKVVNDTDQPMRIDGYTLSLICAGEIVQF